MVNISALVAVQMTIYQAVPVVANLQGEASNVGIERDTLGSSGLSLHQVSANSHYLFAYPHSVRSSQLHIRRDTLVSSGLWAILCRIKYQY